MRIAISITTRDRPYFFKRAYASLKKFLPPGATIVAIDDNSTVPVEGATYRFGERAGIARAKNKAFELMGEADYYFMFDDDIEAKKDNWWMPYINSGLNHAMFIFDKLSNGVSNGNKKLLTYNGLSVYENPCGCMLFFTKKCLDIVGGMDEGYGLWGNEHVGLSIRIHNAGLTPYRFIDVENSLGMFHSHDYHQSVARSVPSHVRKEQIKKNAPKFLSEQGSKEFIPFKKMTGRVITSYLNGAKDPQKGKRWPCDPSLLRPLYDSIYLSGNGEIPVTLITDCMNRDNCPMPFDFVVAGGGMSPYLQRWKGMLGQMDGIREDYVFCVDATDVEMVNNPFMSNLGNYLWEGDEDGTINNEWLLKHHDTPLLNEFYASNLDKKLLNAGVIGGRTCMVREFLKQMVWYINNFEWGMTDMGLFNYVLYTHFPGQIRHGRRVTNVFKSYSPDPASWWKHK